MTSIHAEYKIGDLEEFPELGRISDGLLYHVISIDIGIDGVKWNAMTERQQQHVRAILEFERFGEFFGFLHREVSTHPDEVWGYFHPSYMHPGSHPNRSIEEKDGHFSFKSGIVFRNDRELAPEAIVKLAQHVKSIEVQPPQVPSPRGLP